MRHLVMGTAGHVDHGKTSLIKALTGIDCDTHKAEKERGMTINLGFAHLDCSPGFSVGIVDVPGHRDFVRTMLVGMGGVDIALMVIAADEGFMPQTVEHLEIMCMLRIRNGLVALTKSDVVRDTVCSAVEEDIRRTLTGTFLEGCPVVSTSTVTGEGLSDLRESIKNVALAVSERPREDVFRMFVDRIFAVEGLGTVATGAVIGGSIRTGSMVYLVPGRKKYLRVRRLERHHREVSEVVAGDRAAVNLVGLKRDAFQRGMMISDHPLPGAATIDAKFRLLRHPKGLKLWSQLQFYLGTCETTARMRLLDRHRLAEGESAFVRLRLKKECLARYGDRFVLRDPSVIMTVGGGTILNASPPRRYAGTLTDDLARIETMGLLGLIGVEVRKRVRPVRCRTIAGVIGFSAQEVLNAVTRGPCDDIATYGTAPAIFLVSRDRDAALRRAVIDSLRTFHARHPLLQKGLSTVGLVKSLDIPREAASEAVFRLMLEAMTEQNVLKRYGGTWVLVSHKVETGPAGKRDLEFVESCLRSYGMRTPPIQEVSETARKCGISADELTEILACLTENGKAYAVENYHIHAGIVDASRDAMLEALDRYDEGITPATFRDIIRGNRKIVMLLLAIYDNEGLTRRVGDVRLLTDTGRKRLEAVRNRLSSGTEGRAETKKPTGVRQIL